MASRPLPPRLLLSLLREGVGREEGRGVWARCVSLFCLQYTNSSLPDPDALASPDWVRRLRGAVDAHPAVWGEGGGLQ